MCRPAFIVTLCVISLLSACATTESTGVASADPAPKPAAAPAAPRPSLKETARLDRELGSAVVPYPFTTCAVIQKPFDAAGPKHRRVHQGHEVLFCCTPCVRAFDANPDPYMPRIVAAAQARRSGVATPETGEAGGL